MKKIIGMQWTTGGACVHWKPATNGHAKTSKSIDLLGKVDCPFKENLGVHGEGTLPGKAA